MTETFRDESRVAWYRTGTTPRGTTEAIKLGCLQRIADAAERMAVNNTQLTAERDRFKRLYEEEVARNKSLERSRAALRGVVSRLKSKRKS